MTVHFDTLQFTKTLTEAGIEPRHAEAMARAQARSLDELVGNELATKADIATVRSEMQHEIGVLWAELKSDNQSPNVDLRAAFRAEVRSVRRVGLFSLVLFGLIAVLTELIP